MSFLFEKGLHGGLSRKQGDFSSRHGLDGEGHLVDHAADADGHHFALRGVAQLHGPASIGDGNVISKGIGTSVVVGGFI